MKIGVYFPNKSFEHLDYSTPSVNNPGIGGIGYQFALFIENYPIHFNNDKIVQLVEVTSKISSSESIIVLNDVDAVKKASEIKCDIFLISSNVSKAALIEIEYNSLKTIVWGHNYYFYDQVKMLWENSYVVRNVFCGRQFYDRYIDHEINFKSTFVYNMVPSHEDTRKLNNFNYPEITYIGAVIPSKGLHILTKNWKYIQRKFPNARLNIVGSGALYDSSTRLGPYGLAEENYEKRLIHDLKSANENLDNVMLHGVIGTKEKNAILNKTTVGIPNPTARTETFPISSTDFQNYGVPVLVKKKNGLLDTVIPDITGLTFGFNYEFKYKLVKLIRNRTLNETLSQNCKNFIQKSCDIQTAIYKWNVILIESVQNVPVSYQPPRSFYRNNLKFIRIVNRVLRFKFKLKFIPSLIYVESKIYLFVKKLSSKI